MTLPRSTIRLRQHAQRLSGAVTATPLVRPSDTEYRMKAPVLVAAREFSLFRGIRSTAMLEQQPAAVPAAFRQLSSAAGSNRRPNPSWKLLNQIKKQVGQLNVEITGLKATNTGLLESNGGLKEEITGLKEEITGLKEEITGLKTSNDELQRSNAKLNVEITGLKATNTGLLESNGGLKEEITGLKTSNDELQRSNARLNDEITGLKTSNKELQRSDERLQRSNERLQASNATLVNRMRIVGTHTLEPVIYMSVFRNWLKESVASKLPPWEAKGIIDGLKSPGNNNSQRSSQMYKRLVMGIERKCAKVVHMSVKKFEMIIDEADQTRALRNQAAHSVSPEDVCLAILYSPSQVRRDLMAIRFRQFWGVTPEKYEALFDADKQLLSGRRMENADDETLQRLCDALRQQFPDGEEELHQSDGETLEGEADNDKDLDGKDDQGKPNDEGAD
ncbi:hypothetical protein FN846DRAFT_893816 [Sphaerosporella brunnea]|uniref:Uncharacterized protein n=1 Tax=Sphaerosporella brunnea TaxID=1250544 RepID=A0A5J5EL24_9PEZI|nr:hypothetical protein FN846DRAFT_893816 [Sphaerosporella brunnea]